MDDMVLKDEITKLLTNFRGSIDMNQTFSLWKETFQNVPDADFIMAVNEIIKDPTQKKFPNVAQIKKKLHEIPSFIPERIGDCNLCNQGIITVKVFTYNFNFICRCSRYQYALPFRCGTCTYYSEVYQSSGCTVKRICTVKDTRIKPAPCEWVMRKFDRDTRIKNYKNR